MLPGDDTPGTDLVKIGIIGSAFCLEDEELAKLQGRLEFEESGDESRLPPDLNLKKFK